MGGVMEEEPGGSKRKSLEEEKFDFDVKEEDEGDVEEGLDTEDEKVRFKPPSPGPPIIELRGREVIFAIGVFFLLSVSIGLVIILATSQAKTTDALDNGANLPQNTCVTKQCLYMAAYMMDNMNASADPCENFWNYACGGWLERHSIPASRTSWSVDTVIEKTLNQFIKDLVESPIEDGTDVSAERKVKTLYNRCMAVDDIDAAGARPLQKIIKDLGGWAATEKWTRADSASFDFQKVLEKLHFTYWTDAFFTFWVTTDDKASHKSILQFDQSGLGMPHWTYYFQNESNPVVQAYKKYMTDICSAFNMSVHNIRDFVAKTFEFEKKIANVTVHDDHMGRLNPELVYNPVTLAQLQNMAPSINWLSFLRRNFSGIDSTTIVLVTHKEYFINLSRIISETDPKVLNYYMIWKILANFARELSKPFRTASYDYDRVTQGTSRPMDRWRFCLGVINDWMGMAVGSLFIKKHFPAENKEEVTKMIANLRETFKHRLHHNTWMDTNTRNLALSKLEAVRYQIGYPDFIINTTAVNQYYSGFHISETESYFQHQLNGIQHEVARMIADLKNKTDKTNDWGMNPQEVNAYYSPTENLMVFPAGILQRPYYNEKVPRYINYGGIGATIGHELIHGFDVYGSKYDLSGNMGDWWSNHSVTAFEKRTKCVADYYSNYTIQGRAVDGRITLGENIADIGGTEQAYQAYKQWEMENGVEDTLAGLHLTNDQLFFVAFGQNWCIKRTPASALEMLMGNPHSPEEIRVKGTLSQMEAFSKVFNCPVGSPMRATEKCDVW